MATFTILVLVTLLGGTAAFLMISAVRDKNETRGLRITYLALSMVLFFGAIVAASFIRW